MPRVPVAALALAIAVATAIGACRDDRPDVAGERSDGVRAAALDAGMPEDVAELLALAARGATATFQVTYRGADGAELIVSQAPPNRRVDALTAGLIVQSQVVRNGVGYTCDLPANGQPGDSLECRRTRGAVAPEGTFTAEALAAFADELGRTHDQLDLTVEERTIADVPATCLVAAPVAGTPIEGTSPGVDTICLADDGVQLLVDVGGQRVVASGYSPVVPDGTFDV